jgi:hypothetical protein
LVTSIATVSATVNGTLTGPNPINVQVSSDGLSTALNFDGSVGGTTSLSFNGDVTGALTDGSFSVGVDGLSDTLPTQTIDVVGGDKFSYNLTLTISPTITPTEVYTAVGISAVGVAAYLLFKLGSCAAEVAEPEGTAVLAPLCAGS